MLRVEPPCPSKLMAGLYLLDFEPDLLLLEDLLDDLLLLEDLLSPDDLLLLEDLPEGLLSPEDLFLELLFSFELLEDELDCEDAEVEAELSIGVSFCVWFAAMVSR